MIMTKILIENGKVFVNGEETANPELIGFAVLDIAESGQELNISEGVLLCEELGKSTGSLQM